MRNLPVTGKTLEASLALRCTSPELVAIYRPVRDGAVPVWPTG